MKLFFSVKNQSIKRFDTNIVVADSKNYLSAYFVFSEEWDDKIKTAIFKCGNEVYHKVLTDSECEVPWEVIKPNGFSVSVFAGDLLTTTSASVRVSASGYEEGGQPKEPTPDVYSQIMKMIEDMQAGEISPRQIEQAVEA